MKICIWSDGSATIATKPGGWSYVLEVNDKFYKEGAGHVESATNNDMELIGAIRGLQAALECSITRGDFDEDLDVTLISDSQLILGWASGNYQFRQTEKMHLYDELRRLVRKLRAKTEWVKGHAGNKWNEHCDKLAKGARLNIQKVKEKEEAKITGKSLIGDKKDGIFCIWFGDKLKIISLTDNVIEDYSREIHGKRGSALEIRQERMR